MESLLLRNSSFISPDAVALIATLEQEIQAAQQDWPQLDAFEELAKLYLSATEKDNYPNQDVVDEAVEDADLQVSKLA